MKTYRDFECYYWATPIPDRQLDWTAIHKNYKPENTMSDEYVLYTETEQGLKKEIEQGLKKEIDRWHEEREQPEKENK